MQITNSYNRSNFVVSLVIRNLIAIPLNGGIIVSIALEAVHGNNFGRDLSRYPPGA